MFFLGIWGRGGRLTRTSWKVGFSSSYGIWGRGEAPQEFPESRFSIVFKVYGERNEAPQDFLKSSFLVFFWFIWYMGEAPQDLLKSRFFRFRLFMVYGERGGSLGLPEKGF